ncbi:hypothetical protein M3Y95_00973800 [Aphelenchoides besseyi]|nr:hypothetical protein M3Y95_00973800 [Aphelenchoides besseyi]
MSIVLNKIKPPNVSTTSPICVLLGWGGAQEKQVVKYSQIYESKGCEVIRYIAPFGRLSGRSFASYRKYAEDLYERALVDIRDQPQRPILFHLFSMNGISVFTQTWDLLNQKPKGAELKSRVCGLIFDSGPSDTVPSTSAIAFSVASFPPGGGVLNAIGRMAMYIVVFCYVALFRLIQWTKYTLGDRGIYEREICYYRMLKLDDLPKNQLYLYSKIDTMIRYFDVDRFAEHQQKLGANVTQRCWPDSNHIQHLRKYPDDYVKLCDEFFDKCIQSK